MMSRGPLLATVAVAIVAVAGLGVYVQRDEQELSDGSSVDAGGSETMDPSSSEAPADSPFSTRSGSSASDADGNSSAAGDAVREPTPSTIETAATAKAEPLSGPVDVASIGLQDLPDDEFEALVARLAIDADLRAALIDELRLEADPARRARLIALLGDVGGPDVTALAAELAYSGNPQLQSQGLELLRQIQPGNDDARAIVAGLLTSTTEPTTLLPTLQALARPGVVDDPSRGELASQVALLSTHDDAKVRRLGLDILSRWSVANDHVTVLLDGLRDADQGVREAAAYAFTRKPDAGGEAIEALLLVAADSVEAETVRRGAVRALDGMPLDPDQRQRIADIERDLNRR